MLFSMSLADLILRADTLAADPNSWEKYCLLQVEAGQPAPVASLQPCPLR